LNTVIRRQLTLFVEKRDAQVIENIRKQFNQKQQELIDSHVTLCREDEIENMIALLDNLQQLDTPKIVINFGQVMRFENGKGVLLPSFGDNDQFHLLRSKVLKGLGGTVCKHEPHITFMHPRNSTCTDKIFSVIQKISLPTHLTFGTISLTEQINGGQWKTLKTFKLNDN
jgi:hypothetical protein